MGIIINEFDLMHFEINVSSILALSLGFSAMKHNVPEYKFSSFIGSKTSIIEVFKLK